MKIERFYNQIIPNDFKDVQRYIPDNSIDLIFTDPPFSKKYFNCYVYLADFSYRILKPGGSLVFICPQYLMEDVFVIMRERSALKYRWELSMNQEKGSHARMAMGIEVLHKPILWYVKGSYPQGRGFLRDQVNITGQKGINKPTHKWEQDFSWAEYYVSKLAPDKYSVVLDPFVGSGTLPIVCLMLDKYFIGIDNDYNSFVTCKRNIEEYKRVTKWIEMD